MQKVHDMTSQLREIRCDKITHLRVKSGGWAQTRRPNGNGIEVRHAECEVWNSHIVTDSSEPQHQGSTYKFRYSKSDLYLPRFASSSAASDSSSSVAASAPHHHWFMYVVGVYLKTRIFCSFLHFILLSHPEGTHSRMDLSQSSSPPVLHCEIWIYLCPWSEQMKKKEMNKLWVPSFLACHESIRSPIFFFAPSLFSTPHPHKARNVSIIIILRLLFLSLPTHETLLSFTSLPHSMASQPAEPLEKPPFITHPHLISSCWCWTTRFDTHGPPLDFSHAPLSLPVLPWNGFIFSELPSLGRGGQGRTKRKTSCTSTTRWQRY